MKVKNPILVNPGTGPNTRTGTDLRVAAFWFNQSVRLLVSQQTSLADFIANEWNKTIDGIDYTVNIGTTVKITDATGKIQLYKCFTKDENAEYGAYEDDYYLLQSETATAGGNEIQDQKTFTYLEDYAAGSSFEFTLPNNISGGKQIDVQHEGCTLDWRIGYEYSYIPGTNKVIVKVNFPIEAGEQVTIRWWIGNKVVENTADYDIQNVTATADNNLGDSTVGFTIQSNTASQVSYTIETYNDSDVKIGTYNSGIVNLSVGSNNKSVTITGLETGTFYHKIILGDIVKTTNTVTIEPLAIIEYTNFIALINGNAVDCSVTVTNTGGANGTATVYFQKGTDDKQQCKQLNVELIPGQSKLLTLSYIGLTVGSIDFKAFEADQTTQIEDTIPITVVGATRPSKLTVDDWYVIRGKVNTPYALTFYTNKTTNINYTGNLGNAAYGTEKDLNWLRFDIPAGMDIANLTSVKFRHYITYPGFMLSPALHKSTKDLVYDIFYEDNAMYFQTGSVTKTGSYIEFNLDVTKIKAELVAGQSYYFQLKDTSSNYLSNIGNYPNNTELYFTYA